MRRVLLFFVVFFFLLTSLGCQKKLGVSNSLPAQPRSDYDKFAHIIIDVCDPIRHSNWLEPKSEPERFVRLSCFAGMEKMAKNFEKIQNEKLRSLIKHYRDYNQRKGVNRGQQKKD